MFNLFFYMLLAVMNLKLNCVVCLNCLSYAGFSRTSFEAKQHKFFLNAAYKLTVLELLPLLS